MICSQFKRRVEKYLPIFSWAPKYRLHNLQRDAVAGVTVGIVTIPHAIAFAQLAGVPPQYGLYSSFMSVFVYTLLGTSKDLTVGPTAMSALMTGIYGQSPIDFDPTYTILIALMSGILLFLLGVFQLGSAVDFISAPVLSGFTSAAALTIGLSQFKFFIGVPMPRVIPIIELSGSSFDGPFWLKYKQIAVTISTQTKIWDLLLGITCFAILVLNRYLTTCLQTRYSSSSISHRCVASCAWFLSASSNAIVVIVASVLNFALLNNSIEAFQYVGDLVTGLPSLRLPKFSLEVPAGPINYTNSSLYKSSTVTIKTMSFAEIMADVNIGWAIVPLMMIVENMCLVKVFSRRHNYRIAPNQELIALGLANVAGSLVGAFPVTGSFARTAVNSESGVTTPGGGIFTGAVILLGLGVLTPSISFIPNAVLAAVVSSAVVPMTEFRMLRKLWRTSKRDFTECFITLTVAVLFGVEIGIVFGVLVSLLILLSGTRPKVTVQTHSIDDRIKIIRPSHGLRFPGADQFIDQILDCHPPMDSVKELSAAENAMNEHELESLTNNFAYTSEHSTTSDTEVSPAKSSFNLVVIVEGSCLYDIDHTVISALRQLIDVFNRRGKAGIIFCCMVPSILNKVLASEITGFEHELTLDDALTAASFLLK